MTHVELAARLGLSVGHVNQIANGSVSITTETAVGLEQVTRVPAALWKNLELNYRAHLADGAEPASSAQATRNGRRSSTGG